MVTIEAHNSTCSIVVVGAAYFALEFLLSDKSSNRKGKAARPRQRRSVEEIYECLGPTYFRRAYQVTFESFCILHNKLEAGIIHSLQKRNNEGGSYLLECQILDDLALEFHRRHHPQIFFHHPQLGPFNKK